MPSRWRFLNWHLSAFLMLLTILLMLALGLSFDISQPAIASDVQQPQGVEQETTTPAGGFGPQALISKTPTKTRTPTPINLGNKVWDDLDKDGLQDAGEPGLASITVQLWNSTKTTLLDQDVTDANGIYTVVAPIAGSYRVRVVLPSASDQFSPKNVGADDTDDSDFNPTGTSIGFTDIISIASNVISISNIDAGLIKFRTPTPTRTPTPINLGNKVWDDLDKDGIQDAGEPGLASITVQLWNSTKTTMLDQDVTDASGIYTVVAPIPGSYRVRVVLPSASDQFSPKDLGGDDTDDSDINPTGTNIGFTDIISIASNVISISNIDAGLIKFRTPTPTRTPTPINIGNKVWNDLDKDGLQDAGEPGLASITVQLWNSAKTTMLDQDVTDASGTYTVIAPIPGNYRVRVVLPNGTSFSPKDIGADDTKDSDINPSGSSIGFTDIISIASNVISMSNVDAGLINVPPTLTPSKTPSPSATKTKTATPTPQATKTPTPAVTSVPSATKTASPQPTNTKTATASITPSPTYTPTWQWGVELILNGNFEAKDALDPTTPSLLPWVGSNLTGDKIKCNQVDSPPVAFAGDCAFQFKGSIGENSQLVQTVNLTAFSFQVGDTLTFTAAINGKSSATSGKLQLIVTYADGTPKDKVTLTMLPNGDYTAYSDGTTINSLSITKIQVKVLHTSTGGKVYLDDIRVYKATTPPGTLPLPK